MQFFQTPARVVLCLSLIVIPLQANAAVAKADLAKFFGVDEKRLRIECPQRTLEMLDDGSLEICLDRKDKQRRCEVNVTDLAKAPAETEISFEFMLKDKKPRSEWQSMMQIHSPPDKGEEWRCPLATLELKNGKLQMFNRWDPNELSVTSGYHCTEAGSTIKSREIVKDIKAKPGEWQTVNFNGIFSHENGRFSLKVDETASPVLEGPDIFNDQGQPFLKFGIYKPTSWEPGHVESCVKYRKVKIVTGME